MRFIRLINASLGLLGIDFPKFFNFVRGVPVFGFNYLKIHSQMKKSDNSFPILGFIPCCGDRFVESGRLPRHYFYQDILVARKLLQNNGEKHVDIGSSVGGFVSHVACFRDIEVWDIRALSVDISGITFKQFDITQKDFHQVDYCDSISCLHTIEHFGLGRYGDPVNYDGHLLGWNNIHKMLKKGGRLYFSVPIGCKQGIYFDAHRVFSLGYLLGLIRDKYEIESFSYIDDNDRVYEDIELSEELASSNGGCKYGCGIFVLKKI